MVESYWDTSRRKAGLWEVERIRRLVRQILGDDGKKVRVFNKTKCRVLGPLYSFMLLSPSYKKLLS
jgi:hypothetical protein